jgi:hypothetical protein
MAKPMFSVTAHWDSDARVFYFESDIFGLHIEAPTIDEFEGSWWKWHPGLSAIT